MAVLIPAKLHVTFLSGVTSRSPVNNTRRYTLTHSDSTGDLFLSIGADYDRKALHDLQTRIMRDEVLGEWKHDDKVGYALHLFCHVSHRGLNFGSARWRYHIFRHHMPQVLQALRYGDRDFYRTYGELDSAPILVHFNSHKQQFNHIENWGIPSDYIV